MKNGLFNIMLAFILFTVSACICNAYGINREMHYLFKSSDTSLPPDVRLAYIDSLISISPEFSDSLLFVSANLAYYSGRFRKSLDSMQRLFENHKDNNRPLPLHKHCEALFILTKSYFKCDEYANAIECCQTLLALPKPDSLIYRDIDCMSIINEFLIDIQASDSIYAKLPVAEYIDKAEKITRESSKSGLKPETLTNMRKSIIFSKMSIAIENKDFDDALKLGAEMLRYPVNEIERLALEGNMAMIYQIMENFDMASSHYEKILSEKGWHVNHAICMTNYMSLLTNSGKPQTAIDLMESHPEITDMVKGQYYYAKILANRSYAEYYLGNDEKAFMNILMAYNIIDSIQRDVKGSFAMKLLKTFEKSNQLENKINKTRNESKYIITWLAVSLAVTLCIACVASFAYFRSKRLKIEASNGISPAGADYENGNNTSEPDLESNSPDSGSIVVKTLQIASLNETIANITATIGDEKMSDSEKLSYINSQIKEISSYDDLWDIFHLQFEKMHPSFFRKLKESYPDLTQGETRMCAYVALNMSNKEIAALTRRNIRSVETMRYRLSKKMHLAQGESLVSRLMDISETSSRQ